jgi:transcriptional regulator with XRE-family HTH domain
MKQPELGKRLNEVRIQRGITQKELSDLCSVDIRTIQRIEAGEVEPRMSTLKILAAALEYDELASNQSNSVIKNDQLKTTLLVSLIAGVFYFFNFILYSVVVPNYTSISGGPVLFTLSMVHIITGGLFFLGFVFLGKHYGNNLLFITSILIIILIPLFVIVESLARVTGYTIFVYLIRVTVFLLGITGILFGSGLIKSGSTGKILFIVAGILQIAQNFMFVIPVLFVQYIGLWLAIPSNFVLLLILFFEFAVIKKSGQQHY